MTPITLHATNDKTIKVSGYIMRDGIAKIPSSELAKLGWRLGFDFKDYFTHAITKRGERIPVRGYISKSDYQDNPLPL